MITLSRFGKKGRLGNQLFQYASMIGMAHRYKTVLAMPPWVYSKYFNEYPFQANIAGIQVKEAAYHYTPEYYDHHIKKGDNYDFDGYFQSYKYWQDCEQAVKDCFEFKPSFVQKVLDKYSKKLNQSKKTIAISIRRGDFVNNPNYAQLSINYYFTALQKHFPMWQFAYNVMIFSDDIDYCKVHFGCFDNVFYAENKFDNNNKSTYFGENPSAIEQLCLMSMCDDFIISNSTFSWWGAYLGSTFDSKVIRPSRTLAGNLAKNDTKDYYPKRWIEHEEELIDLSDVTFMIPVHYDHKDREQNLCLNICMLQRAFKTTIIISEQGSNKFSEYKNFGCHYEPVNIDVFHRTKMLNMMASIAQTDIIVNWDADVFVSPLQIWKSVDRIRQGLADVVYPYDGRFARVHRIPHFRNLERILDVGMFGATQFKGMLPDDKLSVGGAIIFNKQKYWEGGGENENFVNYGPEDVEREVRFTRLGYKVERTPGILYHLDHWKGKNSKCAGNPFNDWNHAQLEKIYSFNQKQLREYVDTEFHWKKQTT